MRVLIDTIGLLYRGGLSVQNRAVLIFREYFIFQIWGSIQYDGQILHCAQNDIKHAFRDDIF